MRTTYCTTYLKMPIVSTSIKKPATEGRTPNVCAYYKRCNLISVCTFTFLDSFCTLLLLRYLYCMQKKLYPPRLSFALLNKGIVYFKIISWTSPRISSYYIEIWTSFNFCARSAGTSFVSGLTRSSRNCFGQNGFQCSTTYRNETAVWLPEGATNGYIPSILHAYLGRDDLFYGNAVGKIVAWWVEIVVVVEFVGSPI